MVIPLGLWLIRWWTTRTTVYELTTQRLKIHRGILTRRLEEVELYRVKDYVLEQPLFLRLLGLGNLTLVSSDATTPSIVLRAIAGVAALREQLRTPSRPNATANASANSTWTTRPQPVEPRTSCRKSKIGMA